MKLDPTLKAGGKYGNDILTGDLIKGMGSKVWVVDEIGKDGKFELLAYMNADLSSCSKVPRCWLVGVTNETPMVSN